MAAKAAAVVLAAGVIALVVLAARQARIEAAHDLAESRLRVIQRQSDLAELRARIGRLVTPVEIERLAGGFDGLKPIAIDQVAPDRARTASSAERAP